MIKEHSSELTYIQRSQIVWAIMNRTRYENDCPEKVGIQRLIVKNVYKAAYPLHDGDYDYEDNLENSLHMNERRVSLPFLFVPRGQVNGFSRKNVIL